jgi:hypothetical protein
MSRVSWHIFKNRQPGAHLVVATVAAKPTAGGLGPKYVQLVLERLVRSLKPASYYSTTVVRETGRPEVHLAFADKGDARKLAARVEAEATSNYPGWASTQTFQLDSAMVAPLAATFSAEDAPKTAASRTSSPHPTRGKSSDHALRMI